MSDSFNTLALSAALIAALTCTATVQTQAQSQSTLPVPSPPVPTPPTEPPPGVTVIYVSSSTGSNSGGDGSEAKPYRQIEYAMNKMPPGIEAWCLLKSGDVFPEGYSKYYGHGGASPTERHVIGAYGHGPKPRLAGQLAIGTGDHPMSFVTVRDLDFATFGPLLLAYGSDFAFESLSIIGARAGITVQAESATKRLEDVAVRGCVIADLAGTGDTHGIYVWGVDGLTLEDNVIDHAVSPLDQRSHNLYLQANNTDVVVRRNALCRGASSNEMRCGGSVYDNLLLFTPIPLGLGCGTSEEMVHGGVTVDVRRNTIIGGGDIGVPPDVAGRGIAMNVGNIKSGEITDNVIADGTGGWQQLMKVEAGKGVGVLNLHYHHNIRRKWGGDVFVDPGPTTGSSWTETAEATHLYGVDLSLSSFGHADLYAALRSGAITAPQVNAIVRQRMGLAP